MFFCGLTDGTNACRSRLTAHTYRKSIVYEKKKCLRTLIPKHAHPTGLYPLCQLEVLLMEGRVWDAFRTLPRDWAWESCTTPEASSRPRRRTLGENAAFTQSSSREATGSITNQHRATNVWLGAFSILPSCDIFFFFVFILSFIANADIADFQIAFFCKFYNKLRPVGAEVYASQRIFLFDVRLSVWLFDYLWLVFTVDKKNYFCVFDIYSSLLCYLRNCRL